MAEQAPLLVHRAVWVERVQMQGLAACLALAQHFFVRVGHPKFGASYEVEQAGLEGGKIMTINGRDLKGRPRQNKEIKGSLTLSGATVKKDADIVAFNEQWSEKYPTYDLLGANCQKYARDLIEFLVEGSYEGPCPLPQAGYGAWHCSSGYTKVEEAGIWLKKRTTGKIGVVWRFLGFEAEGPKITCGGSKGYNYWNWGSFIEISLFRIEAKIVPLRARLELNVNTGFGLRDGQFQAKLAGFGVSIGLSHRGFGVSTPVIALGLGKF